VILGVIKYRILIRIGIRGASQNACDPLVSTGPSFSFKPLVRGSLKLYAVVRPSASLKALPVTALTELAQATGLTGGHDFKRITFFYKPHRIHSYGRE